MTQLASPNPLTYPLIYLFTPLFFHAHYSPPLFSCSTTQPLLFLLAHFLFLSPPLLLQAFYDLSPKFLTRTYPVRRSSLRSSASRQPSLTMFLLSQPRWACMFDIDSSTHTHILFPPHRDTRTYTHVHTLSLTDTISLTCTHASYADINPSQYITHPSTRHQHTINTFLSPIVSFLA